LGSFPPSITDVCKERGRVETRQIQVKDICAKDTNFPFAEKMILLRRHRHYLSDGHQEEGFLHLICSRKEGSDAQLLNLCRGHWIIESSVHYCRDVLFREDHSQIRDTTTARICATMHSLAVNLLGGERPSRRDTRPRKQKRINRHPGIAVRMVMQTS